MSDLPPQPQQPQPQQTQTHPSPSNPPQNHKPYLTLALSLAHLSPPKPTNYRVGAILIDPALIPQASHPYVPTLSSPEIISTGYTLELPGNTHAEQCCIEKLKTLTSSPSHQDVQPAPSQPAQSHSTQSQPPLTLYTTLEPCVHRLSTNTPCTSRILAFPRIRTVVVGVYEPDTFVAGNNSRYVLEAGGVEVIHVPGMEGEILSVAMAGHVKSET